MGFPFFDCTLITKTPMNKYLSSLGLSGLLFLLLVGGAFGGGLKAQEGFAGGYVAYLNGEIIAAETLRDRVLCASDTDTLQLVFEGMPSEHPYLLTGLRAVAQIANGAPTSLLKRAYSEPGPAPSYTLAIKELGLQQRVPNSRSAYRVYLTLGQVATVEGRRVLSVSSFPSEELTFSFLLTPACQ
ncbi:MAG: hypothetical protein D6722_21340 [Bacteroidetes bacterium]|nr:MAG: hypothetical protein D6722_21340 [Bacteroidota bacterium]